MSIPKYLEMHAVQTVPFSNLNRDDLGAPKTVVLGGVERTRISSQCWKRPIRLYAENELDDTSIRTRRVILGVAERLRERGWDDEEADSAGIQVARSAGKGISLKPEKDDQDRTLLTTNVLLLLPESGIDELADLAVEHRDAIVAAAKKVKQKDKMDPQLPTDKVDEILSRRSGTINLLGRMLAELPGANVDGAVQMAHAFTTHGTNVEYDYFTAVDDVEQKLGQPGSGHINTAMYSAGTFYRYANVNIADLLGNLDGDTKLARELVRAFAEGFISTLPSGKQNATAPMTVPDIVYLTVRDDRPVSLASAFESPVTGTQGYSTESVKRLDRHAAVIIPLLGDHHVLFSAYAAGPNALDDGVADLPALGQRSDAYEKLVTDAVAAAFPETGS